MFLKYFTNKKFRILHITLPLWILFAYLTVYQLAISSAMYKVSHKNVKTKQIEINNQNLTKYKRNYFEKFKNDDNCECIIPKLDEWDWKIKKLIKRSAVYNKCAKNDPLTYINNTKLYFNQYVNKTFYNGTIKSCELAIVLRKTKINDSYILGKYVGIKSYPYKIVNDFVKVRCMSNRDIVLKKNQTTRIAYEYVHSVILKKENNSKMSENKINVVLLILDGVSLSSMKRSLPKSFNYLKSLEQFFLFEKHHVTGENTFQNLVPMLTNLESEVLLQKRDRKNVTLPFDEYPFIWKNFSER